MTRMKPAKRDELDFVRFEFGLDRLFKGLAVAA